MAFISGTECVFYEARAKENNGESWPNPDWLLRHDCRHVVYAAANIPGVCCSWNYLTNSISRENHRVRALEISHSEEIYFLSVI
jgi:hypothetical protein